MKKVVIEVCVGTTCYVMGSSELLTIAEELLPEENTHVELKGITCLEACNSKNGAMPCVLLNGRMLYGVTLSSLVQDVRKELNEA